MTATSYWQGERVRLAPFQAQDWEMYYQWSQDATAARQSFEVRFPNPAEGVRRWAERTAEQQDANSTHERRLQIQVVSTGEMIGIINTYRCDPRQGFFFYGIGILDGYQGHGYGSEAILLLLRYYFLELRYQKANAEVYGFNAGSQRLQERLGFTLEGRLRRMIFTQGQHYDLLSYGMTLEEFYAQHRDWLKGMGDVIE